MVRPTPHEECVCVLPPCAKSIHNGRLATEGYIRNWSIPQKTSFVHLGQRTLICCSFTSEGFGILAFVRGKAVMQDVTYQVAHDNFALSSGWDRTSGRGGSRLWCSLLGDVLCNTTGGGTRSLATTLATVVGTTDLGDLVETLIKLGRHDVCLVSWV